MKTVYLLMPNLKLKMNLNSLALLLFILTSNITSILTIDSNLSDLTNLLRNSSNLRYKRNVISGPTKLIDDPLCPELRQLCSGLKSTNDDDLTILECIQTFLTSQIEALSDECQHSIWSHTNDMVQDKNVHYLLTSKCTKDIEHFSSCEINNQPGHYLGCVIDKRDDIKSPGCNNLIQRLEWVAFSDFRLIGMFVRDCESDITTHGCGRLNSDKNKLSQGETIACLQTHLEVLAPECKKGIIKVSEQQGDNIKADRQLFILCTNEMGLFCSDMRPGTGQVYKCLMRNRNDPKMSKPCYNQLLRRDKLVANDYKVSRGLAKACKDDIKLHHCRRGVSEDKDVRLSQILLCLEAVQKNSTKVAPECLTEINEHRKMLMDDYQMTPEIVTGCSDDIQKFCDGDVVEVGTTKGGKVLHCLMEHARKKKKERRVTSICQRALEDLIKVSDVGEDWRVDPVLRDACKPVVDVACHDATGGDARVMSCLMEKLQTNHMTKDCEQALMQIQYFVARDFKLDPQLYRNCKSDAIKLCRAKKNWADVENVQNMDPERGPLILPCLHRYSYHNSDNDNNQLSLKSECLHEVKRVMRQRAVSVDLIPEVEDECLEELSNLCFDKTGKGEEMTCLQDNLEKLSEPCRKAVSTFTEDEAERIDLNPVIVSVCQNAMQEKCDHILNDGNDEGDMMECLISHKNDPELRQETKCRAAIEHFQIISLKNYHFTYKFKEACRPHVTRFCPQSNTKYDVVACLSEVMRNDTLKSQRHSIPKECRQQVRAQLYQQRENIDLNPKLKDICSKEIQTLCNEVPHGVGQVMLSNGYAKNVLECLQTKHGELGQQCRHAIFAIKKSELSDSGTDYTLINTCRTMINLFCRTSETSNLLECLKLHKEEHEFDQRCRLVVVTRMIEQNLDYRFNPKLQEACNQNIADYCSNTVASAKQDEELNGKVIGCLKTKFREGKLTNECQKEMTSVLHEQALNYKLNPLLQSLCKDEIEVLCHPSNDEIEDHGYVEECLKNAFLSNRILTKSCKMEIATIIQEAKADIHVDPLLQQACKVDLLKYCSNIDSGNGRLFRCLQVILNDESKALEGDCRVKLTQRMEMYKNAVAQFPAPENLGELYSQVVTSPARRYLLLVIITLVGIIFILGIFCGRVTRRTLALKNK